MDESDQVKKKPVVFVNKQNNHTNINTDKKKGILKQEKENRHIHQYQKKIKNTYNLVTTLASR